MLLVKNIFRIDHANKTTPNKEGGKVQNFEKKTTKITNKGVEIIVNDGGSEKEMGTYYADRGDRRDLNGGLSRWVCMCKRNTRRGFCPFCFWTRWGKGRCERTRQRQWLPRGHGRAKNKKPYRNSVVYCCGITMKCVANKDVITNN